jgi:hypothetical protein
LPKIMSDDCGLSELSKAKVAIRLAEAEKNMIEGADEYLRHMTESSLVLSCYGNMKEWNFDTRLLGIFKNQCCI